MFYNLGKGEKGKGFKKCDFLRSIEQISISLGKLVNDFGEV